MTVPPPSANVPPDTHVGGPPGASSGRPTNVPIRTAASVLMLRDGASGLEVFVQHRVNTMDFAAGVVVFPGGRVDPTDREVGRGWAADRALTSTYDAHRAAWARTWVGDDPHGAETLVATAVREVGEESGATLNAYALLPWANWVTPPGPPKRFDTYFFVTDGNAVDAVHQTTEAHVSEWDSVPGILTANDRGTLKLMTPTRYLLTELAGYSAVEAVLSDARRRIIEPVRRDKPGPVGTGIQ